jgi:hypothetical protein
MNTYSRWVNSSATAKPSIGALSRECLDDRKELGIDQFLHQISEDSSNYANDHAYEGTQRDSGNIADLSVKGKRLHRR